MAMLVKLASTMAQSLGSRSRPKECLVPPGGDGTVGGIDREVRNQTGIHARLKRPAAKKAQRHSYWYAKKTAKRGASPAPRLKPSCPIADPTARSSGNRYI